MKRGHSVHITANRQRLLSIIVVYQYKRYVYSCAYVHRNELIRSRETWTHKSAVQAADIKILLDKNKELKRGNNEGTVRGRRGIYL